MNIRNFLEIGSYQANYDATVVVYLIWEAVYDTSLWFENRILKQLKVGHLFFLHNFVSQLYSKLYSMQDKAKKDQTGHLVCVLAFFNYIV